MPYIKQERRRTLDFIHMAPDTTGELNYVLTQVIREYTTRKGLSYSIINDVVGALEGAKAEYQRRIVAPYEDGKIAENGDVF